MKTKKQPEVSTKPEVQVRLNAFDKNGSGSFSETIFVTSVTDFRKQEKDFFKRVPFHRFYTEHEVTNSESDKLEKKLQKIFDEE